MPLSLLHANDKKGEHAPSWYAASVDDFPEFAPLNGDHRFDVCIIGGGYSGISSALHLSERGYSVCILEAHRVAWGASGRNGGQVAAGQRKDPEALEKMVGKELAKGAFEIGVEAARLVRELIDTHKIKCDYMPGVIEANHRSRYDEHVEAHVEKMARDYGCDWLDYLPPSTMSEKVGSPDYSGGMLDRASGHVHPLNYALGLARAAREHGARFFELSEVLSLEKQGSNWCAKCKQGTVRATTVIMACNGYQTGLVKETSSRIMPINNFIIATEPLSDQEADGLIRDREAVFDTRHVVNYFRLSKDNRMLFGGGENYGYRFPSDIKAFVRPKMLQIFPQLKDAKIDYGWGGTLGITVNRVPEFSFEDNLITIAGYSGSGVAMATMGGKLAAEAVDGQLSRFDIISQLPTPKFPGGSLLRWPTLVAAMLWFSLRDRL